MKQAAALLSLLLALLSVVSGFQSIVVQRPQSQRKVIVKDSYPTVTNPEAHISALFKQTGLTPLLATHSANEQQPSKRSWRFSLFRPIRTLLTLPYRTARALIRVLLTTTKTKEEVELEQATTIASSISSDTDIRIAPEITVDKYQAAVVESAPATTVDVAEAVEWADAGDRRALAASHIDLSGEWDLIVTDDFKEQYDKYLTLLGQPALVRSVALSIVGMTTEETVQLDKGRKLIIRGRNVRGVWERTLEASGPDGKSGEFTPLKTSIKTADDEDVEAEAWWQNSGTVHCSWLRGVKKYGGGDFESKRYLEHGGNVLVCESVFHPTDDTREKAVVTWRFLRKGNKL